VHKGLVQRIDPWAVLSVVIPLFVYLLTLAPSVTFFDSGEFLTAIPSLGSSHSPGYPLFINYGKPFTWLPFGSIAFRINFATAFSAAMACYAVYLLSSYLLSRMDIFSADVSRMPPARFIALAAALTFACTARLWLQSNHDKPYPLVSFLAAIIFYLLLLWREGFRHGEDRIAYIYLGAFLFGLTSGAHQTIILMLPCYGWLILSADWRQLLRLKELLLALTFAILGFAINLHLPVRAMRMPLLNWGDPRNLDNFLWHFLRKGYPVDKVDRDLNLLWTQLSAFNLPYEFTVAGLALLFVGIVWYFRPLRDEIAAYGIGVATFLFVIVGLQNTPAELVFLTEEFFTPLYLLSAVMIGLGFAGLCSFLARIGILSRLNGPAARLVLSLLVLVVPVSICASNYRENDQHNNFIAHDYASNTLRTLPQGAVLYTWGDSGAFPLWYLQGVERMREDLDILHTPHLVFTWYLDAFPDLFRRSVLRSFTPETLSPDNALRMSIAEQMQRRPVYVDFSTRYSIQFDDHALEQEGICYRLRPGTAAAILPPDLSVWGLYNTRGLTGGMFFRDLDTGKAIQIYGYSHLEAGETLLKLGRTGDGIAELRQAVSICPDLEPQAGSILVTYGVRGVIR
jgi:hypothetical protein